MILVEYTWRIAYSSILSNMKLIQVELLLTGKERLRNPDAFCIFASFSDNLDDIYNL